MNKLKNIKILTTTALLVAIATIFGFFKLPVNNFIEIRFAYLPIACAGMFFGPVIGGLVGILSDLLGFFVRPTGPFFPGFTISSMASGIVFGLFFYKKKLTLPRVIVGNLAETAVVSFVLNTINLMILYGNPFWVVFSSRLLKTAVQFPIDTAILFVVLTAIQKLPFYDALISDDNTNPFTGN